MKQVASLVVAILLVGCKGSGGGVDHGAIEALVKKAEACKDVECAKAAYDDLMPLVQKVTEGGKPSAEDVAYVGKKSQEIMDIIKQRGGGTAAAPGSPTPAPPATDRLSRYELLWTAYTACKSDIAPAQASPEQTTLIAELRANNAKRMARVGVTWAPYPTPVGDPLKDAQSGMFWYLSAMTELAKHVDAYPEADKMLVPVGQTACTLSITYDPASPTLDATVGALGRLGKFTGLDPTLVTALTDTLAKKVPAEQGQAAASAFFKGALAELKAKP